MQEGIIINASETQKQDFQEIGTKTYKDRFLKKLKEKSKECGLKHIPFDYACAKFDYESEVIRIEREMGQISSNVEKQKMMKIDIGNLDKYADEKRFNLVNEYDKHGTIITDGIKTQTKEFRRFDYVCKPRGHGVTIDMPWNIWKEQQDKTNKSKEKSDDNKDTEV